MEPGTPGSRQVGTGEVHNLTKGSVAELRNPATRTVGFSPDGSLVTLWSRVPESAKGGVVDAGWAVPTMGGQLRPYLKGALRARLVARRSAWSTTRRRMAIRCSSPSPTRRSGGRSMWRGQASTTTFPSGRTTARSSTSSRASAARRKRRLAHSSHRWRAGTGDLPQLTRHVSNPAGQPDTAVPRHRR